MMGKNLTKAVQKLRNIPRKPHNHVKEHQFIISTGQKTVFSFDKKEIITTICWIFNTC